MPWIRLDDHFDEHPKLASVGPLGLALWVTALAYCNRNLTDGFIPTSVPQRLVAWEDPNGTIAVTNGMQGTDVTPELVVESLLQTGLWRKVKGGYRIHDYHEYQPTKAQVLAEREAARARMRNHRKSRGSPEQTANSDRTSPEVPEKFAVRSADVQGPRTRTSTRAPSSSEVYSEAAEQNAAAAAEPTEDLDKSDPVNRLLLALRHRDTRTENVLRSFVGHVPEAAFDIAREEVAAHRGQTKNDAGLAVTILQRIQAEGHLVTPTNGTEPEPEEAAPPPLVDLIRTFIEITGWQYDPQALADEIADRERKRGEQLTPDQRAELLELHARLHTERTPA